MILLVFLLLATASPGAHQVVHTYHRATPAPTATPKPTATPTALPTEHENQDKRIADETARLAWATFALAFLTALAVGVPVYQRWRDRSDETNAAMRQVHQMLILFQRRVGILASVPWWTPQSLLEGLDVVLARALADDIAKAMPRTTMTTFVYSALFAGFDAITDAVHWDTTGKTPNGDNVFQDRIRQGAKAANAMLNRAIELVITELKKRNAAPAPSEIGTINLAGNDDEDGDRE